MGGSSLAPDVLAQRPAARRRTDSRCASSIRPIRPRSAPRQARMRSGANRSTSSPPSPARQPRRWPSWRTSGSRGRASTPTSRSSLAGAALCGHHRPRHEPRRDPPPRHLPRGVPQSRADVGGRYSALTYVGLVPGALLGLDLRALLDDAAAMARRCRGSNGTNPGLWLGVTLGALARAGRDKLTLVIEPRRGAPRRVDRAARSPRAPASTAWASSRSTASRSARPRSTAMTASSCASAAASDATGRRAAMAHSTSWRGAGHPVIEPAHGRR